MKNVANKKNLLKLTGLVIFLIIIFTQINFKEFYSLILTINPWIIIAISLLSIPPLLIKMLRWYYILKKIGINYPLKKIFRIYHISLLLGRITPASSGDAFGRIAFLKKDGHQIKSSLVSVLIDRLADVIILLLIIIVGILSFAQFFRQGDLILPIIFLIVIVLGFASLRIKIFKMIADKVFLFIVPKKFQKNWQQYLKKIINNIKLFGFKEFLIILGLTALAQLALLLFSYTLIRAIGIYQISPLHLLLINAIISFVVLIPISIDGLGTREAALLVMFSIFGVKNEQTILFSLLAVFLSLVPLVCISLYCWLKNK